MVRKRYFCNWKIINLINERELSFEQKQELVNDIGYIEYKVGDGETLYSICNKLNIDYSQSVSTIAKINNLKNVDMIVENQNLLLPIRLIKGE